jgi:VWFA-related protein
MSPRAVAFALLTATALAAAPRQTPQRPPVFRAGVDLTHLDVTVLDRQRRPVRGLTAADFTILEDGVPQPIVAFDEVVVEAPPLPPVAWMRDIAPDVTDNSLDNSRLFVIVIDDAQVGASPGDWKNVKDIARQVIDRLGPSDYTAVLYTALTRNVQDFTTDRAKLLERIDTIAPGVASDPDAHSIATLQAVSEYLTSVPYRRKALIWISPGPNISFASAAPFLAGPTVSVAGREAALSQVDRAVRMLRDAQRANVAIYGIDPGGLAAGGGGGNAQDFLHIAASHTGARAVVNTNDFTPGIDRIFVENSAYYLLGFRPAPHRPGTFHRLEVKVNREDVEVHTRNGYFTAEPPARGARSPSPLGEAIAGVLPNPDLPMQVTIAPFAIPGQSKAMVTVALGVRQPIAARPNGERTVESTELQTSAFTPDGDAKGTQRHTARVTIRPGAGGDAEYEALSRIDLNPGRYRLRLAAHSAASGRTGSVFADVEIPDFSRLPFSMSGAILHAEPGRPAAPADLFRPLLPFAPTAERDFLVLDRVTAFAQVYQDSRRGIRPVQLVTRVVDAKNLVVVNEVVTLEPARFQPAGTSRADSISTTAASGLGLFTPVRDQRLYVADLRYRLPLERLSAGPHLLTLAATRDSTMFRRDVRFRVR